MELIRWTAERFPGLSRSELARTVCENLSWKAPSGQLQIYACLPLLDDVADAGVIHLPPKGERASRRSTHSPVLSLPALALRALLGALRPIRVEPVPAVWVTLVGPTVPPRAPHACAGPRPSRLPLATRVRPERAPAAVGIRIPLRRLVTLSPSRTALRHTGRGDRVWSSRA